MYNMLSKTIIYSLIGILFVILIGFIWANIFIQMSTADEYRVLRSIPIYPVNSKLHVERYAVNFGIRPDSEIWFDTSDPTEKVVKYYLDQLTKNDWSIIDSGSNTIIYAEKKIKSDTYAYDVRVVQEGLPNQNHSNVSVRKLNPP